MATFNSVQIDGCSHFRGVNRISLQRNHGQKYESISPSNAKSGVVLLFTLPAPFSWHFFSMHFATASFAFACASSASLLHPRSHFFSSFLQSTSASMHAATKSSTDTKPNFVQVKGGSIEHQRRQDTNKADCLLPSSRLRLDMLLYIYLWALPLDCSSWVGS